MFSVLRESGGNNISLLPCQKKKNAGMQFCKVGDHSKIREDWNFLASPPEPREGKHHWLALLQ